MNDITHKILIWYEENKRDLPWRETDNPYKIWLSEVILQQTRVNQGLKYYLDFVETWPTVSDLAEADDRDVMKHWQGLGYYTRARNLLKTARIVAREMGGRFPDTYEGLLGLPGVGPYTASAVASIAFGRSIAVVDGNVERVISRLFGITSIAGSVDFKRHIRQQIETLIHAGDPGTFNQAVMEFGALMCVPSGPDCEACPLHEICMARKNGVVNEIPLARPRPRVKNRYFNYLVMVNHQDNDQQIVIRKRVQEDIWNSLYDFPLIETRAPYSVERLMNTREWEILTGGKDPLLKKVSRVYRHVLTHRRIIARFIILEVSEFPDFMKSQPYQIIPLDSFHEYPTSRLIEQFYQDYNPSHD